MAKNIMLSPRNCTVTWELKELEVMFPISSDLDWHKWHELYFDKTNRRTHHLRDSKYDNIGVLSKTDLEKNHK